MKVIYFLLLFSIAGYLQSLQAATLSGKTAITATATRYYPAPKFRKDANFMKVLFKTLLKDRKFSYKQKILIRLVKWQTRLRGAVFGEPTPKQLKLGRLSLIFAIAAIVAIAVPYAIVGFATAISIITFPLAITAFVLGIKSLKGNSNTMGMIGMILSGAYLLLFIISILVLLLILAIFLLGLE